MTSWSTNTPRVLLELVENHSEDVSEQQYIDICNMLKYVHHTANNLEPIRIYIEQRMNTLRLENAQLLKEYKNIQKPRITNGIKNKAHWNLLKKNNGLNLSSSVELHVNPDNTIKLNIIWEYYCGKHILIKPEWNDRNKYNNVSSGNIQTIYNKLETRFGKSTILFEYCRVQAKIHKKMKEVFLKTYFEPHNKEVEEICNLRETLFGLD